MSQRYPQGSWPARQRLLGEPVCSAIVLARTPQGSLMLQCVVAYPEGLTARLVAARPPGWRVPPPSEDLFAEDAGVRRHARAARRALLRDGGPIITEVRWPDGRVASPTAHDDGVDLLLGQEQLAGQWTTRWLALSPRVPASALEITAAWPAASIPAVAVRL